MSWEDFFRKFGESSLLSDLRKLVEKLDGMNPADLRTCAFNKSDKNLGFSGTSGKTNSSYGSMRLADDASFAVVFDTMRRLGIFLA